MDLSFEIPGKLSGKGRPRYFVRGSSGKVGSITPKKTRSAEVLIRQIASDAMNGRDLFEGPVLVNVTMWLLIPASWSKKRKLEASYATGKPDVDNIAKLVGDSMNGIVFKDDSQIASLHITRHYGSVEKAIVSVQQLSGWKARKAA